MFISRNARRMGDALTSELERIGCTPVEVMLVGQDPVMLNVRYVVVARDIRPTHPGAPYKVFSARDWTLHPNPRDRERGVTLGTEAYWRSYDEAMAIAEDIHGRLLREFAWVHPGTRDLVPGCNGYGRGRVL